MCFLKKYKFIYFSWRLITLQYCIGFAIHQHESTTGYTCVPHPEPLSNVPPCTIPLGHLSAPAPSILYHASNLDWWFISYIILYMFLCHSPKLSHPLPLPLSPKVRYTWFCFYFKIFSLKCGPFSKSLLNLSQYCFCFMFWLFGHKAYGILALNQQSNLHPLHWKVKS